MISVIVPIYNTSKYLRKCVDSILAQTYQDLEILLVDDGSTDDCPAICDAYAAKDHRVRVIHQKNCGLSAARNAGIKAASGTYITFVDSDDYIETDTYEKVAAAAGQNQTDLIFFREKEVDLQGNTTRINGPAPTGETRLGSQKDAAELVIGQLVNGVCDKVFPRKTIENLWFETGKMYGEDFWFNLNMLTRVERIAYIDSIQYSYVGNEDSVTHASFNARTFDQMYFKDKVAAFVKSNFPAYYLLCSKRAYMSRLHVCRALIAAGEEKNYAEDLKKIKQYLKNGYPMQAKQMNLREKTEYRLFCMGGLLYRLFLKAVDRAHRQAGEKR